MLTEQPILITSIQCKEPGGIIKNRFINFEGVFGAEGVKSLGVVNADTNQGEMTPVTVQGIAIVQVAFPVTVGQAIQVFDDGTAAPHTVGNPIEGYAMDTASAAYQLIRILLA